MERPGTLHKPQEGRADELLVLAAASLTDVLPRVARAWERESGVRVRFSFDATSRLAPQALQGAQADVFASADRRWMSWLARRGAVDRSSVVEFLENRLVVVVPAESPLPRSLAFLADADRVALAGENVPAGRYARRALETAGVWDAVEGRVVRAGSVRSALEWVARGEVEAGVVYATDARAEPKVVVAFELPGSAETPVRYPFAVLTSSRHPGLAREFVAFAAGEVAAPVFRRAGFGVLDEPERGGSWLPGTAGRRASPGEDPEPAPGPSPWAALRLSLLVATLATLAGFVPAVALGWLLARREFRGKVALSTLVMSPLVMPPVVTGFLLLRLLGSESPLGRALEAVGLPVPFTLLGASLAALTVGMPLYVLSARNAFAAVDPHYEEVSWTLGVARWRTFLRVSLPLALPGIAAGAVLTFARALGEFGATVVLAGNVEGRTRTIALAVYTLLESPAGHRTTWVLVAASIVTSLAALVGYEALSRRQRRRLEEHHGR